MSDTGSVLEVEGASAQTPNPPGAPANVSAAAPPARMRRAFLGAACISLQPVILSAIMLPVTAYVIRGLGPTGYGQWAMATTLVAVVTFVTNLGLRGAFVRAVARAPESAAVALADQLGVRVILAVLAAGLAVAACALLGYSRTVVLCTALSAGALLVTTLSTTAADLLQALQRLPTVAVVNLVAGSC
jgi:O-antigen/teichoic acid export membrane protein